MEAAIGFVPMAAFSCRATMGAAADACKHPTVFCKTRWLHREMRDEFHLISNVRGLCGKTACGLAVESTFIGVAIAWMLAVVAFRASGGMGK